MSLRRSDPFPSMPQLTYAHAPRPLPRTSSTRAHSTGNLPAMSTTAALPTTATRRTPLLRAALKLDAIVTGANGAAYLIAAGPLGDLLGLSPALLRGTGAFLIAFAAAVYFTSTRPQIPRTAAYAIVAANAVWAIDSAVAAIAGWGSPETAGTVWIVMQAIVVAGFAELQLTGLRRKD
jgi:hypothetical protein